MRIDAFNRVQQLYGKTSTTNLKKEKTRNFSDQLEISNMGKDIQVAKQAVKNSPDVREDVMASIKERLNAGTYQVNTDEFADKLFERYQSVVF